MPDFALPGPMTDAAALAGLPADVSALAAIGHGLLLHEHWAQAYGVTYDDEARMTVHLRPVERLLERVLAISPAPLTVARPPTDRVAANCRHFTVLMVSALRAHGVPARARCGFGGYFTPGFFEDHWVCEYWTGDRWRLVDAQLDAVQRTTLAIDFDVTDVPRDRFLVAGDAWRRWRAGAAAETDFGSSVTGESGAWWIAGNLMRDAAALLRIELLPWDEWGVMPAAGSVVARESAELFDRLAAATVEPDAARVAEVMAEAGLRVPPMVRNALLGREEVV
jgi:transglutaminase superfamily protein